MRKICIILISFILMISIFSIFFTTEVNSLTIKGTYDGDVTNVTSATKAGGKVISTVLSLLRMVAAAVAIIMIIVLAMKYMLASAGERAEIKKYAMNYVMGAFILFGTTGLISMIKKFVDAAFSE